MGVGEFHRAHRSLGSSSNQEGAASVPGEWTAFQEEGAAHPGPLGESHQVLHLARALMQEGKGHKQSNALSYQWVLNPLYTYRRALGLLICPTAGVDSLESPAKPNTTPH